jgi:hypothetical protein
MWILSDYLWGQRLMTIRSLWFIALAIAATGCTEPSPESRYEGAWQLRDTLNQVSGEWIARSGGTVDFADQTFSLSLPTPPTQYKGTWSIVPGHEEVEMLTEQGAWFGTLQGVRPEFLILNYSGCCRAASAYRFTR